jgi:ABC-type hemin transport system ATPase subunit
VLHRVVNLGPQQVVSNALDVEHPSSCMAMVDLTGLGQKKVSGLNGTVENNIVFSRAFFQ